jgi:23S rRNA (uracil1939-C5)-methyltransferase
MSGVSPTAASSAPTPVTARVDGLDGEGRGVVRIDGTDMAIDGALAGEKVLVRCHRRRRRGRQAELVEVLQAVVERATPPCAHFALCGGCWLQHMGLAAQLHVKQRALMAVLAAHVPEPSHGMLEPLVGPSTGYRRRARLGVKYVPGKGGVLVGFREKFSNKLAEIRRCEVLDPRIGHAIADIRRVLGELSIRHRVPQLEVALGDADVALVLRHLDPLSDGDRALLAEFVAARRWQLYLQPGGPASIHPLEPAEPRLLSYHLPAFHVELSFAPTDFVQVNAALNTRLVAAVVEHLDLRGGERVLDLFSGIGNFTLPAARRAARVLGVEGDAALVSRARDNARVNDVGNARFVMADLQRLEELPDWWREPWDRLLLDPPRSGAAEVISALTPRLPGRIVYVSCNPQTLARDAAVLVHDKGYRLRHAGVVDMFPHTMRSEAMAVFDLAERL